MMLEISMKLWEIHIGTVQTEEKPQKHHLSSLFSSSFLQKGREGTNLELRLNVTSAGTSGTRTITRITGLEEL